MCTFVGFFVLLDDSLLLSDRIAFLPMIGTTTWTFFSSTVYHSSHDLFVKERNRQLDKTAIFLMIMGSGITTIFTCHDKSLALVSAVCLCVVLGFLTCKFCTSRDFPDWLSVSSYIVVGWTATFPSLGIFSSSDYTDYEMVSWILFSGALYCIGVIFYSRDSIKWFHTIWHLFVMAGAGTHIWAHIYVMQMKSIPI